MVLNGIIFPNHLIDSIRSGNLVIFAGAGASAGSPTLLPTFNKLAEMIAEDTGNTLGKNDSCEVFLGSLKSKGIDVNAHAAEILSDPYLEHNKLHEAIVDTFFSSEFIRIVTTNYDKMFEQALESKGITVPIFSLPALPSGNDVQGIVHIHGIRYTKVHGCNG